LQTPASYASFQSSTILSKTGRTRREESIHSLTTGTPNPTGPDQRATSASTNESFYYKNRLHPTAPTLLSQYLPSYKHPKDRANLYNLEKERKKKNPAQKKSINQRPQWQSLPHPHPHPPPFLPPPRPPHEKNPPPPPPQTQNNTPPSTHHKKKNQNPTRKKKKRNNESPASRSTPTTAASATTSSSPRRGTSTVSRGGARPRPTGP